MNQDNSILFLGDVVPYKTFRFKNNLKSVINLECPIVSEGVPISGKVNFRVSENHLYEIFGDNLFAVNMGNNHIMDYGVGGLEETLKQFRNGTHYFGIRFPGDTSHHPLILDINGVKAAFFSVTSEFTVPLTEFDDFNYLELFDPDRLSRMIAKIRNEVHRVVVYLHWGTEESSFPGNEEIITARKIIDAGADIIIGAHAHAPQPVEKYKGGIIAYNLGNFITPAFRNLPSYYNDLGTPLSEFSKRLMFWNRISWGIAVDMLTMEYEVKKYGFVADRIIEMKSTPMDRYLHLQPDVLTESYSRRVKKHIENRAFRRRMREMLSFRFSH